MSKTGAHSPTALITDLHLKKVLKTYTQTAMNSLNGPGSFQDSWKTEKIVATSSANNVSGGRTVMHHPAASSVIHSSSLVPQGSQGLVKFARDGRRGTLIEEDHKPPFPVQPSPLFSLPEQATSERCETHFEGQAISYFLVGGEKRLCLPQLLNTVLTSRSLEEINAACDELRIYISRCTVGQLDCLKACKILPVGAPSCGLITLTDAERLCGALMHRKPDQELRIANRDACRHFPVMQRCFGKIEGTCFVDLYVHGEAACIECSECRGLFSPRHFVLHNHKSMEQSVCHWGFDSHNWRRYLLIPEDQLQTSGETVRHWRRLLEELTTKSFGPTATQRGSKLPPSEDELSRLPSKRIKIEEAVYPQGGGLYGPVGWFIPQLGRGSTSSASGLIASPNDMAATYTQGLIPVNNVSLMGPSSGAAGHLNRGPPLLINPDRHLTTAFDKADEKVQPNVALAPVSVARPQSVIQQVVSAATLPLRGSVVRKTSESLPSTSRDEPDSGKSMRRNRDRVESEDDTSSSNSTLSIDLHRESAILEEDEEDLNSVLQFVDLDTRARLVHGIKRLKHRYSILVTQAQHDHNRIEKHLHHYKYNRKERVRELKTALTVSQQEIASLTAELTRKTGELDLERRLKDESESNPKCPPDCSREKGALTQRIRDLEKAKQEFLDQLENVAQPSKSPVLPSPGPN